MEFHHLLDRVRMFADNKLKDGASIMQVSALFRDAVLPKQFAQDDESAVKRAAQIVITELQTNRTCKHGNKGRVCAPIGKNSIDHMLFGFDDY